MDRPPASSRVTKPAFLISIDMLHMRVGPSAVLLPDDSSRHLNV